MVRAGEEFAVEAILERRGFVAIVPMIKQYRRVNRYVKRKHQVSYPLIARYVLVGFDGPAPWHEVFDISMVQSVVGVGDVPQKMQGRKVAKFLVDLGEVVAPEAQQHMRTHQEFEEGDDVEIIGGVFDGHVVRVHKIEGSAAQVLLPLFGSVQEVPVPLANLVKSA
jgi:transcription antitermination factor NusG